MTSTPLAQPAVDALEMRRAMGQFASGITIVTGTDTDGQPLGFACQSFSSLSLDPALILICVDERSRSWPLIAETGRFTVNVLAADQSEMCNRFGSSTGARFEGLDWTFSDLGTPSLPDALMRVHARVHSVVAGGDHSIVIGEVAELDIVRQANPLLFFRGKMGIPDEIAELRGCGWGWE